MIHILKIDMGLYYHWALESNSTYNGKPTLISNTKRNGTVREEAWDKVVADRKYKRVSIKTSEAAHTIINRARQAIGKVSYGVTSYNCEHFIRELITGVAESKQLQKAVTITACCIAFWAMTRKR